MSSCGVVEAFDVIEDVGLGFVSGSVALSTGAFGLEAGEEALHRGVVPAVARPAHAAHHAVILQQRLKRFAGVLATFPRF